MTFPIKKEARNHISFAWGLLVVVLCVSSLSPVWMIQRSELIEISELGADVSATVGGSSTRARVAGALKEDASTSLIDATKLLGEKLGEHGSFQATRFAHEGFDPFFIVHPWVGTSPESHRYLVEFTKGDTYAYIRAMLKVVLAAANTSQKSIRCIDIGTNIGYVTHTMASAGCEVWGFEANPRTVAYVRQSIALNGLTKRIHLTSGGVSRGDEGGHLTFAHETGNQSEKAWSVSLFDKIVAPGESLAPGTTTMKVPLVNPLKHLPSSSDFAMFKIDCEGCEPMAIESLAPILKRGGIHVLLFEWEFARLENVSGPGSGSKMLTSLLEYGYDIRSWDMSPVSAQQLTSDAAYLSLGDVWAFAPAVKKTALLEDLKKEAVRVTTPAISVS